MDTLYQWPEHIGVQGNEEANALEKLGSLLEKFAGPEPVLPILASVLRFEVGELTVCRLLNLTNEHETATSSNLVA